MAWRIGTLYFDKHIITHRRIDALGVYLIQQMKVEHSRSGNEAGADEYMKTVSERIFELMKERGMSQKTFSEKTGIAQSTISDWKKKKTNPVSDKILIISETLGVSPYELLSGAEHVGTRSNKCTTYVVDKGTELGNLIEMYQSVDVSDQKRIIGYMQALMDMKK